MKNRIAIFLIIMTTVSPATATEEAPYTLITRDGRFEVRDYAPQIVAQVLVTSDLESAGDQAFRPLFRYITGANQTRGEIAMTAPVGQQRAGEKIAMTAPVGQESVGDQWAVTFMMPATYTMETLPAPDDPAVTLREIPARRMAVVRYRGFWSERRYQQFLQELETWMQTQELSPAGDPVWARYNPPFTPWFLRRNEIMIPLKSP